MRGAGVAALNTLALLAEPPRTKPWSSEQIWWWLSPADRDRVRRQRLVLNLHEPNWTPTAMTDLANELEEKLRDLAGTEYALVRNKIAVEFGVHAADLDG